MGNLCHKSHARSCIDSSKLGPFLTSFTRAGSTRVRSSSHEPLETSVRRVLPVGQEPSDYSTSSPIEDNVLVWLTESVNPNQSDFECLRRKVRHFQLFTDIDEFFDFTLNPQNQSFILVVSDRLEEIVVPRVHPMSQFNSIYILGPERLIDPNYPKSFPKVRGLFTSMELILEEIRSQVTVGKRDLLPIERLLVSSILIRDFLKQILLVELHYPQDSKRELVAFARQSYPEQSTAIDEFERDYTPTKAVWWLRRKCFLYEIINDAYRTMDVSRLMKIGFFLRDVHQQMERSDRRTDTPRKEHVYGGQGLTKAEFEFLQAHPSDLFSSKHLLWTTTTDALIDARLARNDSCYYGVVFRIQSKGSLPFLPSGKTNASSSVLFSLDWIFRRGACQRLEDRIWQVDLVLLDEQDPYLNKLRQSLTKNLSGDTAWERLSSFFIQTKRWNQAELLQEELLASRSIKDPKQLALLHEQLASAYHRKEDLIKSLLHYKQAVKYYLTFLPSNDVHLFAVYYQIAILLYQQNDQTMALKYLKLALSVALQASYLSHLQIANLYQLIGKICYRHEMFMEAIQNYQLALANEMQVFPTDQLSIAATYTRLGEIFARLDDYPTALSYYEKTLVIRKKCLLPNHSMLARSYYNLAECLYHSQQYKEAVEYTSQALNVARHSFGSHHPRVHFYEDFLEKILEKTSIGVIPNGAVYE